MLLEERPQINAPRVTEIVRVEYGVIRCGVSVSARRVHHGGPDLVQQVGEHETSYQKHRA